MKWCSASQKVRPTPIRSEHAAWLALADTAAQRERDINREAWQALASALLHTATQPL